VSEGELGLVSSDATVDESKGDVRDLLGDEGVGRRSFADFLQLDGSFVSDEGSEDVVDEGHGSLREEKGSVS